MSIAQLLEGRTERYFRDNADTPGTLWVFQHIPKTAGSSFRQEMADRLGLDANIHADHRSEKPARESLDESLQAFLGALPTKPYRFVSGHLRRPQVQSIVRVRRDARLVTMLRDPVARVVSDFRYMRTPSHPSHAAVIAKYPRFEDFLDDPVPQNKMFRFLRRTPKDTVEQAIASLEQDFTFIGTQESYAWSCSVLFRLLASEAPPKRYERKTEDRSENSIPNLAELEPLIRERNSLDAAIYTHFSKRLTAVRPAVERYLDAPRPAVAA